MIVFEDNMVIFQRLRSVIRTVLKEINFADLHCCRHHSVFSSSFVNDVLYVNEDAVYNVNPASQAIRLIETTPKYLIEVGKLESTSMATKWNVLTSRMEGFVLILFYFFLLYDQSFREYPLFV